MNYIGADVVFAGSVVEVVVVALLAMLKLNIGFAGSAGFVGSDAEGAGITAGAVAGAAAAEKLN